MPGLVGASNMPRSGPSHRSCRPSATSRPAAIRPVLVVRSRVRMPGAGSNSSSSTCGIVGSRRAVAVLEFDQRLAQHAGFFGGELAAERGSWRPRAAARPGRAWSRRADSGFRHTPLPGASLTGVDAGRVAERGVFAFDVEHERAAAEQQHPPQEGFDAARSCRARSRRARPRSGRRSARGDRAPTGQSRTRRPRSRSRSGTRAIPARSRPGTGRSRARARSTRESPPEARSPEPLQRAVAWVSASWVRVAVIGGSFEASAERERERERVGLLAVEAVQLEV